MLIVLAIAAALLAAGVASYFAVTGGSPEPAPTPTPTATTTPTATGTPTATATPTVTATASFTALAERTATPHPPLQPGISCPGGPRYHLNIELLQAQPGIELIISGWGKVIGIGGPGDPSNEQLELIGLAIDAVAYEC